MKTHLRKKVPSGYNECIDCGRLVRKPNRKCSNCKYETQRHRKR